MVFQASWFQGQLASQLKSLRESRGWSTRDVASKLGWSQSKVSRVESGKVEIKGLDVMRLGQLYELPEERVEELRALAVDSRADTWYLRYTPWMKEPYVQLVGYEAEAIAVRSCQPSVVPGLLQTPDYARAVIVAGNPVANDEDTVDALLDVRLHRQRRLEEPDNLQLHVVIGQSVLHWQHGGPRVWREQLKYLREMADRPNITIQVVPYTNAVILLPLEVFQFEGGESAAVAFSETLWTNVLHEGPQEARRAQRMFDRYVSMALPAEDSKTLMEQVITESSPK